MQEVTLNPTPVIRTLNDLIDLNRDSQNGFLTAANNIDTHYIKAYCLDERRVRTEFMEELQSIVRSLGEAPDETGSVAGVLRRGWMSLKSALGGGVHAILIVVEAGEAHAVREYQRALATVLPDGLRGILERQCRSVTQAHHKIKAICDSLKQLHHV